MRSSDFKPIKAFSLSLIVACSSVLTLGVCFAEGQPNEKIRIALNLPLSGPIAAFSGQFPNAFSMGIEDGCKQFAVDKSHFDIDSQDNGGKPSQSVTVCQKQLMEKPSVYISGTSQMSLPIAPAVSHRGIPHIFVAFDAFICRNGTNRLRFEPNFKIEAPVYVDYVRSRKAKRIYVLNCNYNSCNEQFDKLVLPELTKLGVDYKNERFDFDTKDYRSIALKVKQYNPDLIIVSGYSVHLLPLISALRNYQLVHDGNVIATLDLIDLLHSKVDRNGLAGVAFTSPDYEIPGVVKDAPAWAKRYEQRFGKEPSYVEAYAYDTGRIFVSTYKRFGKIDGQSLRAVLPFYGICGKVTIDRDGDLNSKLHVAQVTPDGAIKQIDNRL
jgi:branched-chain amino acid transport system substrate-binding protein